MTDQEQKEWDLKLRKMDAEIAKVYSDIGQNGSVIANLKSQTTGLVTELSLFFLGGVLFAVAVAFAKFFL